MGLDEATCMLLLGITLLSPDRPGLIEKNLVSQSQEKFIQHLEKYVKWRFGPTRGQVWLHSFISNRVVAWQSWQMHLLFFPRDLGSNLWVDKIFSDSACIIF
jgi:hypothetical protein